MAQSKQLSLPLDLSEFRPKKAGIAKDLNGRVIGKYVFLDYENQEELDKFATAFLETYRQDSRFFLTLDLETTGLDFINGEILLHVVSWDGEHALVIDPKGLDLTLYLKCLETIPLNFQNGKFDLKWLLHHYGVEGSVYFDTMVAAQAAWADVFPGNKSRRYGLANLAKQILGYKIGKDERLDFVYGAASRRFFDDQHIEYAARDGLITHKLVQPIMNKLHKSDLLTLWETIERPLIEILFKSEYEGIYTDKQKLKELYTARSADLLSVYNNIQAIYKEIAKANPKLPYTFNPGSPKQIVKVLHALGIRVTNTKEETLLRLSDRHEIIPLILDYRHTQKELSTYIKSWLEKHINPTTECIHPTFNSYGTATGRLSCTDPNMQNIPPNLRSAIKAREGYKIITADFSQFEFRAVAAIADEPVYIDNFVTRAELYPQVVEMAKHYDLSLSDLVSKAEKDEIGLTKADKRLVDSFILTDIHRRNASLILGVDIADVTPTQRLIGKCVSVDTTIFTKKGLLRVGDLLPPNPKKGKFYDIDIEVLTDEGYKKSNKIYYRGKAKGLEITTEFGRKIIVSPQHKFRAGKGRNLYSWVPASDLRVGNKIYTKLLDPPSEAQEYKDTMTNLYVYYMFLSSCKEASVIIKAPREDGVVPLVRPLQEGLVNYIDQDLEVILKNGVTKRKVGIEKERRASGLCYTLTSTELKNKLIDSVGKHRSSYRVPKEILQADDKSVLKFLQTFFRVGVQATDSWKRSFVRVDHLSQKLLQDIANLLLRFGIMVKITKGVPGSPEAYSLIGGEDLFDLLFQVKKGEVSLQKKPTYTKREMTLNRFLSFLPRKTYSKALSDDKFGISDLKGTDLSAVKSYLTKTQLETVNKMGEYQLYPERIVDIQEVDPVEMCDVSVEDNHTVVYEGFVTHNTMGFLVLYRGSEYKAKETLAKDKIFLPLEECRKFLNDFFANLKSIKREMERVDSQVLTKGYVETFLGRKRFFTFPPKYRTYDYKKAVEAAKREAFNFLCQGSNADATKMAVLQMEEVFRTAYPPERQPRVWLTVHDETVIHCPEEFVAEVAPRVNAIMVESGEKALLNKVPIEVTLEVSDTWTK